MANSYDPTLSSAFRMEWLVPIEGALADDFERAVAEKAASLLRSARFIGMHADHQGVDMEVRVWVEAAASNACVSITWEPGVGRFGFHLLDEALKERLACIVFEKLPCVDAQESVAQEDRILAAALEALREGRTMEEKAQLAREATKARRVEVRSARDVDLGVDP